MSKAVNIFKAIDTYCQNAEKINWEGTLPVLILETHLEMVLNNIWLFVELHFINGSVERT